MNILLPVALLTTSHALSPDSVYWWNYTKSDCGYDDVSPQPSCGKASKGDVEGLKKCCLQHPIRCGGFNTNGIIKKKDCSKHIKDEPACDLYLKMDKPQPPPPAPSTNWPPIWPLPSTWSNGTSKITLAAPFFFLDKSAAQTPTVAAAFKRYLELIFNHVTSDDDAQNVTETLPCVTVIIADTDESHPQLGVDESYTLNISMTGWLGGLRPSAVIQAPTIWGALHGLETFSQLVRFDFDTESYYIPGGPWTISDQPRFPHRGLMVDTARHFQSLRSMKRIVDSLPYAKINVLHWHMVDTQSFPMQSKSSPKLWNGAYSPQERYTQKDVAAIVEYARLRGVRVMVEFDMPGHAASWCAGYPEICPSTTCLQPLNVATNATFDLITGLLEEMTGGKSSKPDKPSGLFPDNLIHLGGDEVNTKCWTSTPAIKKWLDAHGLSADDGYAYFVKRAASIAIAQGRRPIQWVEVFDHFGSKLDKSTIVHVWKAKSTLTAVVAAGYNALINNSPGDDSWYLDHLDIAWKALYANEPCADITDPKQCKLVLGGQGEMWGETVDVSDIQSTVWPRLGAIAERLWSPRAKIADADAAHARMRAFRCLLNRRGIAAAPVDNAEARAAPHGPGGCFEQ